MKKELELFRCCICGKECCGYGNNPWPIKDSGKCCDECNNMVLRRRITLYTQSHRINKEV